MSASFTAQRASFSRGDTTPRSYLERCLDEIDAREGDVRAFVHLNISGARAAADESTRRYREGRPLSPVDGMPIGIKDVFDTADMPTEMGTPIHKGRQPTDDAAHVRALRQGGAIILGKTVTSQFAIVGNGPTRNPHDLSRSPGATSAGSAAAVAAGMLPVATGSQARGSIIRPASYCGVVGFKPTFGALNRAGCLTPAKSYDHLGALARSIDDLWYVLWQIAQVAGGDPGRAGLLGEPSPPLGKPLTSVVMIESPGWREADDQAKAALGDYLDELRRGGVRVLTRETSAEIDEFEKLAADVPQYWEMISNYENRWPLASYRDRHAGELPPGILRGLEKGERMTPEEYRSAMAYRRKLQQQYARLRELADVTVTLSAPGAAPLYPDSGSSSFNELATLLDAPAVSVPLLAVGSLALGVQLIGHVDEDYSLLGHAVFLLEQGSRKA